MNESATNAPSLAYTLPSDRVIRTERIFAAPRARVWSALTEPRELAQWWGRGNRLDVERLDLVRDGAWRFVEHTPEGSHGFGGRYREVLPPQRLVNTFEWDGAPGRFVVVTTTLDDLGDGRTRVVTESLFLDPADRDANVRFGMIEGMRASYAALDALLAA